MVRISNKNCKHEIRKADTWISRFFPENNKIQGLGKGGIQVAHRVPGDPDARLGNALQRLHAGPLQKTPTATAILKSK